MRARAAAKTGLSLTVKPRAQHQESSQEADRERARQVAWGALLVSAAAIAGYLLGPQPSVSAEGGGARAPESTEWMHGS